MSKYKVGDRFIVRIDGLWKADDGDKASIEYILNNETQDGEALIKSDCECVVTEDFLDRCSPFDIICRHEKIATGKLLPCPFCGCKMHLRKDMMADKRTIRYTPQGHHKHGCQLQFAGSAYVGNPTTISGAIKKWNRRNNKQ